MTATSLALSDRTEQIYLLEQETVYSRTDRMFAVLMLIQYFAGIAAAIWISPRTWEGTNSSLHMHVWAAVGLGGVISALPIYMAYAFPGFWLTRHVIAVGQSLTSALLIHLCGGRIETHFHVFGSLAFLAFYRDWKVLMTATVVIAADHYFRGVYWPRSVFDTEVVSSWRWMEHSAWVVFEDIFLVIAIRQSCQEMRIIAERQAKLESTQLVIESEVRDRTAELVASQSQLEAAMSKVQSADRAKSEFLANMSHEIRTPLNGVIGMTELLCTTELTAKQSAYLEMVRQSADSLLSLLNDSLDFSKIEAGKLEREHVPFQLRDFIGKTVKSLGLRAADKGLELNCRIAPNVPDELIGDPSRLVQVLVNLAGNSLKFTHSGEVLIEVERETQTNTDVCLHVTVSDTGIGIPQDKQQTIFKPFQQADNSTTRRYGGTGLGLTISAQLVKLMQGRIWVESELGKGTQFHFTVHFEVQNAAQENQPKQLARLKNMRVLLVENQESTLRVLDEMVKSWNMQTVTANHGELGLAKLQEAISSADPFDLVLIDTNMPQMNGFEFAQWIRQQQNQPQPAIIMLSSAPDLKDAEQYVQLGIDRWLTKPILQSELLNAILEVKGHSLPAPKKPEAHTSTTKSEAKLRILVAEDGIVNQAVARGFLEDRGYETIIANNGKEALDQLRDQAIDLILMDVQMPEMDGLVATTMIRKQEEQTGRHIPIIAMTANALKGDRERCLQAGMDSYLAKPINSDKLYQVLAEYTSTPDSADSDRREHAGDAAETAYPTSQQTTAPIHAELLNPDVIAASIPGGMSNLPSLTSTFAEQSAQLVQEMQDALQRDDFESLQRAAHTLRGSAAIFGAEQVMHTTGKLETLDRFDATPKIQQDLLDLQDQLDRLTSALTELAVTDVPPAVS